MLNKQGKGTYRVTDRMIVEYRRINNTSKRDAAFQLDKKVKDLESYSARPTQSIDATARKEISSTLIEVHRLLTDLTPDWKERYPQIQDLHNHIDTELKKKFPQTSDNPPLESGFPTKAADPPFYETPYRPL